MVYKILRAIRWLTEAGVTTTAENLMRESGARNNQPVNTAEKNGLIYKHRSQYYLTEAGEDELAMAAANPYATEDGWGEWRTEALTGMDKNGDASCFENPAIPKSIKKEYSDDGFFNMLQYARNIEEPIVRIMDRYSYTVEKTLHYYDDERIDFCNHCNDWGVMRRDGHGYLENKCTICTGRFKSK